MDKMLYIAMNGAQQTMIAQTANSNNLANVTTTGFRADFEQFRSMPVFGNGIPSRVYAMTERPATDYQTGPISPTGRDLDVSIQGEGFIAVQSKGGDEAYTRAGDFKLTPNGQLITGAGLAVIGEGGPISIPPAQKIDIGPDGTISIVPLGEPAQTLAVLDRIKLVKPDLRDVFKGEDGLIRLRTEGVVDVDASVKVASRTLEGSNVNAAGALVNMIELQRQYEMQVKMMKAVDENSAAAARMLQFT
ncbi:MAG: flagellar biosynthesis protein FlgF [Gammaproteobacteria bacterium]|nr:MAG: flagellar biosynthesis protein FlgF [Gammaproteobacteria bacterium]RKZ96382.1 MAG: flagellar biosynthesis protein FlgF [Gammaproteobacteria bacterium]RLA01694.1 MAG: flagellar biosynthesis protein FlgF [Gammaproteobacteria bacterium]